MGVLHLHTFLMKEVPNCVSSISMIDEIDVWLKQNPNEKPTIVIDFRPFTYAIANNLVDSFFGGRSAQSFKKTEDFLSVFHQKGVKLVYFSDGPPQPDKSEKVNDRLQKIFKTLDHLYECNEISKLIPEHNIGRHGCLEAGISAVAQKFGEHHNCFYNDRDKSVAAFATKVNAMAVISNNTDYLIFKGNWNIWSSKHINFNTLTTLNYSKIALQQYLKLTDREMPLLATLAGNDFLTYKILDRFHRYLGNPWHKFINISRYIIKNFLNEEGLNPDLIARKVFGNISDLPEYADLVRKSLNSYNIDILDVTEDNEDEYLRRIRSVKNDCYMFLKDMELWCPISNFDVRKEEYAQYPSLAINLFQRQLGMVLKHKNDKTLTRRMYCYQNEDKRYVYVTLHPEYPPISVPDLEDLYNADKNEDLKKIKLQLLLWILSERLDINKIINIDKKYFCVCLTLYYMVENSFITVQEADIFLHMIETVYEKFSTTIDLPYLERVDTRAFQIVYLYIKLYKHIIHAIRNCGLFELLEHNHIDGLYFHHVYNKMLNMKEIEQMNVHQLEHLRLYASL